MKKLIVILVAAACATSVTMAASYSTEATITRQKDKGRYLVDVQILQLVEHEGQLTERLVARPRIDSAPGVPASLHQGPQPSQDNYQKEENVSVDVSWPEFGKTDFATCTVIVKLGDKMVSKSKLQVMVDEPAQKTKTQQPTDDKDTILPGRHLSESQVADIVLGVLPRGSNLRCEFKDGVWEILEVQKDVWGVSSRATNADGKITIQSTNAARLVLRVRDADGKFEPVKTP